MAGTEAEVDKNAPWWSSQIRWAVQTVGISGVILGAFMYGGYRLMSQGIAVVEPRLERVTNATIDHMAEQTATTKQISETMKAQYTLIEGLHDKVDGVSVRLERVETKLDNKK